MSEPHRRPRLLEFFSATPQKPPLAAAGEPPFGQAEIVYRKDGDQEIFESTATAFIDGQALGFVRFEDCDLNLSILEFAPGFLLPLHSHRADCLYYVERGSLMMGGRELGPGEGFLVRANQPYGYMAGPSGVRVIEFRSGITADFTLEERNVAAWKTRFLGGVA